MPRIVNNCSSTSPLEVLISRLTRSPAFSPNLSANGLPIKAVGPPAASLVELPWEPAARGPGWLRGRLLYCDRFGNLVTNIPGTWLNDIPRQLILQSPRGRVPIRRGRIYADGAEGAPVAIVGSDGMVEIAVFAGRAAQALGLEAGDELVLSYTTDT